MAERAVTPELGTILGAAVEKAARYYATLDYGSFAPVNADGGLTTIEEKSMGAYAKSGSSPISGDVPPAGGLYLLDVVPDGEARFRFPNISDNAEIVELIASGCHLVLFVTGTRFRIRLGAITRPQDSRQSRHLSPSHRRHGYRCRPHSRRTSQPRRGGH